MRHQCRHLKQTEVHTTNLLQCTNQIERKAATSKQSPYVCWVARRPCRRVSPAEKNEAREGKPTMSNMQTCFCFPAARQRARAKRNRRGHKASWQAKVHMPKVSAVQANCFVVWATIAGHCERVKAWGLTDIFHIMQKILMCRRVYHDFVACYR